MKTVKADHEDAVKVLESSGELFDLIAPSVQLLPDPPGITRWAPTADAAHPA
jgi:hypothetical protein